MCALCWYVFICDHTDLATATAGRVLYNTLAFISFFGTGWDIAGGTRLGVRGEVDTLFIPWRCSVWCVCLSTSCGLLATAQGLCRSRPLPVCRVTVGTIAVFFNEGKRMDWSDTGLLRHRLIAPYWHRSATILLLCDALRRREVPRSLGGGPLLLAC